MNVSRKCSLNFVALLLGMVMWTHAMAQNPTIDQLEAALAEDPSNHALNYYLGVLHQREGNIDATIEAWDAYVKNVPFNRRVVTVKEQLTILRQRQATEYARQAATGSAATAETRQNSIAVLEFRNPQKPELKPFVKGMNAMIITDLSKVPQLTVVERTKIQALMTEMNLAAQGLVDQATSGRVGQLLAAHTIDWGELDREGGELSVRNFLSDTSSNSTFSQLNLSAPEAEFFELEKNLVFEILAQLGIGRDDLSSEVLDAIERVDTRSYQAFIAFGEGLVYLDEGDFSAADASFEKATELDPDFDLAAEAAASTPSDGVAIVEEALGFDWEEEEEEEATEEEVIQEEGEVVDESLVSDAADSSTVSGETSDVALDDVLVESDGGLTGGPLYDGFADGFVSSQLVNGQGEFHGVFYTPNLQHGSNFVLTGTAYGPSFATIVVEDSNNDGSYENEEIVNLTALQVSDSFPDSPITGNIPQELTLTDIGDSEFMQWGGWSLPQTVFREPSQNVPSAAVDYIFSHPGFWLTGDATTPNEIASLNSSDTNVIFAGNAIGVHFDSPNEYMLGSFTAAIDATQLTVTDFDLEITSATHSLTISNASGAYNTSNGTVSMDNGTWFLDAVDVTSATSKGVGASVFGPDADELGGTFWIDVDGISGEAVNGIFYGDSRPRPTAIYLASNLLDENGDYAGGLSASTAFEDPGVWGGAAELYGAPFDAYVSFKGTFELVTEMTVGGSLDSRTITGPLNTLDWDQNILSTLNYVTVGSWLDLDLIERLPNPIFPPDQLAYQFGDSYVAFGAGTTANEIASLNSANTQAVYTGDAFASVSMEPGIVMSGTFTAVLDLVALTVTDFDLSVFSPNFQYVLSDFTGTIDPVEGVAFLLGGTPQSPTYFQAAGALGANGGAGLEIRLALFGPDASEVGGTFQHDLLDTNNNEVRVSSISGGFAGTLDPNATPPAPRPTLQQGYFTNILVNDQDEFHGIYHSDSVEDLASWNAIGSAFLPASATGTFGEVATLEIGSFPSNPVDGGLPNTVDWSTGEYGTSEYMVWGEWSDTDLMSRTNTTGLAANQIDYRYSHTGFYVYGDATTQTDIASLAGTLTYTGDAFGVHFAEPNTVMQGTFSSDFDFTSNELLTFSLNVSSTNHSLSFDNGGSPAIYGFGEGIGTAQFTPANIVQDGVSVVTPPSVASVYFTLYGPAAQEAGGLFSFDPDGSGANAVQGMFRGTGN